MKNKYEVIIRNKTVQKTVEVYAHGNIQALNITEEYIRKNWLKYRYMFDGGQATIEVYGIVS